MNLNIYIGLFTVIKNNNINIYELFWENAHHILWRKLAEWHNPRLIHTHFHKNIFLYYSQSGLLVVIEIREFYSIYYVQKSCCVDLLLFKKTFSICPICCIPCPYSPTTHPYLRSYLHFFFFTSSLSLVPKPSHMLSQTLVSLKQLKLNSEWNREPVRVLSRKVIWSNLYLLHEDIQNT